MLHGPRSFSFGKMSLSESGMMPVARIASYKGLIFGSLSPEVPDLADFLGDMKFFIDVTLDQGPNGMEFIDQPELQRIFIIDGENRDWRRIAMEPGRKHPSEDDLIPSYFGDSIGWWEGDTLVVDTVGYN